MQITFKSKFVLQMKKPFTLKETYTAQCLGMENNNGVISVDLRTISNKALYGFMKSTFPVFMLSSANAQYRSSLFAKIKETYIKVANDFLANYYPNTKYDRELFNHQKSALTLMTHRQHNLLAFSPGAGKTITSASISKILKLSRTIIICPASLKFNWYNELSAEWGFDPLLFTLLDSKKSKCLYAFDERFVICNFEMVERYYDHLTKYEVKHFIIDEAHYAKNTKTKRFKNLHKLIKKYPNARVTMLTGTPIVNRVNDMFSYFKLVGHPLGDNYAAFLRDYTIVSGTRGSKIIGSKNIDDLRLKINNLMIRVRTEDCVDLPELMVKKYFFELGDIKGEYEQYVAEMYNQKKALEEASDQQEKNKLGMAIKASIHTLNRLLATSKVQNIIPLIDQLIENDRDVIVFSGYRGPLLELEEHYGSACSKVIGGMSAENKNKAVQRFTKDKDCRVFLGNFVAAGVGINLVNSQDVIFLNMPFTPDLLEQSYKRAFRIGQKNNVRVYYALVRETIDERLFDLVTEKSEDTDALVDEGSNSVIHYRGIQGQLFNNLMSDYEKKNNIVSTNQEVIEFASIK